jgi:hypothetical protein
VLYCIICSDPFEIENLTAAQDRGKYFMLFSGSQNKNSVGRGLFQGFQEGIKGGRAEHMNLVYHIYFVPARLGYKSHLLYQVADILYRIIGSGIQLKIIHGSPIVKRGAALAFITGFPFFGWLFTIDGLGQDTGTGGFTHPSRSAKQKGMCQLLVYDRIAKRCGNMRLPHNGVKSLGPVFSCRYDEFVHEWSIVNSQ